MYEKRSCFITIGSTLLYVEGSYSKGSPESAPANNGQTAPVKPDFEISSVMLALKDGDTDTLLCTDITQMLEDINSITWRNKTGNDIFEHIIKEVIVTLALEDINY
jgi:hypothetical protein